MSRGGKRPGAGRKPGVVRHCDIRSLRNEARQLMADMIGTGKDPVVAAVELYTDPQVPLEIRAMLILGMAKFFHPTLSAQTVQATSVQVHLDGDVLAAKTALLLERHQGAVLEGEAPDIVLADLLAEAAE